MYWIKKLTPDIPKQFNCFSNKICNQLNDVNQSSNHFKSMKKNKYADILKILIKIIINIEQTIHNFNIFNKLINNT